VILGVLLLLMMAPAQGQSLRQYAARLKGPRFWGYYSAGRKVGWLSRNAYFGQRGGKTVLIKEMVFLITTPISRDYRRTTVFALDREGRVESDKSREVVAGSEVTKVASATTQGLAVKTSAAGKTTSNVIPFPKDTLKLHQQCCEWLKTAKPGQTFPSYTFELARERESSVLFRFEAREKLPDGQPCYRLSREAEGRKAQVWMDANLHTVRVLDGTTEVRQESEAQAKNLKAP
jgi:hypothetical protein